MLLALSFGTIAMLFVVAASFAAVLLYVVARGRRAADPRAARQAFEQQRLTLQTELLRRAAQSGRPRGLRWKQCDCDPQLTLARDTRSGRLVGFAGVTVSFEAIAGGPMEEVEAVGNLRACTAVFHFERGRWSTDGRVLFNLDPADAVQRFAGELQPVESPPPQ